MEKTHITWEAFEYPERERSKDWYWAVGIITIALAATSIILKNFLFALLILIASFTLIIFAKRKPRMVRFELNEKGIITDTAFYPYSSFESFWVIETETHSKLLLKYNRAFVPHIALPIAEVHPEDIREFLLSYLHEVEDHEPLSQKIMERLGF